MPLGTGGKATSRSYYGPWLIEPKNVFIDAETAVKNLTEEQIAEFRNAFRLVIITTCICLLIKLLNKASHLIPLPQNFDVVLIIFLHIH